MRPPPRSSTRRLCAGLWIGAIAALIFLAPVLPPTGTVFAHEPTGSTSTDSMTRPPTTQSPAALEGLVEIVHEDRATGGGTYHHVLFTDDQKRWSLDGVPGASDLITGDWVRVQGDMLEVLAFAPPPNTFGSQKTLVILVNFSNDRSQPYTVAQAKTGYGGLDNWFREVSYQQTSLVTDVVGWYTMSVTNASCDYTKIQTDARQAATAAGINLSTYIRHVFAFPFNSTCQFAGLATVGGNPSSVWINGSTSTGILAHEFGHTLGLYHSHALNCHPTIVTPPCSIVEYGDTTDTMGGGTGHYNAFQKQRIGWLDFNVSPPITTVQTSGDYTIDAYEFPGTIPKALQIARGTTGESFYVELRRNQGWDTNLFRSGVFVHMANEDQPDSSKLLDMTPATSPLADDAFLDVGKSFTDPVSGVRLTTLSVSSTSATIMVDMAATPCTRSAPSVTASPAESALLQPGTAMTYNVTVTNTDTTGCSASTFTLQATAPTTDWQTSFGVPSFTMSPGVARATTLQITSSPDEAGGAYTIVAAATSTTDSTLSGSTSVIYNVDPDDGDPGTPGTFTDNFNRPDSPVLGNGWSVVAGSFMIQSLEGRNKSDSPFSLAVQPGLTGMTQTVAASFTSTDNNASPIFGVVLRYRNAQNYYKCYRLLGGSSSLRISKVQNGVETVLKSVGIVNPTRDFLSKLSCTASGTSLTLRIDGVVKVSAIDGALGSGNTGFVMSTLKAGSHRIDNFSATATTP